MLTRVTHSATIARERAITSKIIPRLQTQAAMLTRIWRALVQNLARIYQHIHRRHIVIGVCLRTVIRRAHILGHHLATVVQSQAAKTAHKTGYRVIIGIPAANIEHLACLNLK